MASKCEREQWEEDLAERGLSEDEIEVRRHGIAQLLYACEAATAALRRTTLAAVLTLEGFVLAEVEAEMADLKAEENPDDKKIDEFLEAFRTEVSRAASFVSDPVTTDTARLHELPEEALDG